MLKNGILNPQTPSLLALARYTNLLGFADRGFYIWQAAGATPLQFDHHLEFMRQISRAVRLIRTGDGIQYANTILVSGPGQPKRL